MIWLLAQIGLLLLLAAIVGWFVGWSMRGFREQDRVEDLRQELAVTKDINDRELSEARRRVGELEGRLARQQPAQVAEPEMTTVTAGATALDPEPQPEPHVVPASPGPDGDQAEDDDKASPGQGDEVEEERVELGIPPQVAAAERARRREAEEALRRKTAAVLTLQAESEALREAVDGKAKEIAKLEEDLAEALAARSAGDSRQAELDDYRTRLRALQERREQEQSAASDSEAQLQTLRTDIAARDRRINDLRNRCATLETELSTLRADAGSDPGADARLEGEMLELRRALQRQIERNRKQESVHRAVVAQLEGDKARLRAASFEGEPAEPDRAVVGRARHSTVDAAGSARADDLTAIRGVGPGFARQLREIGVRTFREVAEWTSADVERISSALGTHPKRVYGDRWIEQAAELGDRD